MHSFNANFIVEKNKRADGPTPINLLKFGFATPVYVSDRDVTPSGGSAHSGIVKTWGFIDTGATNTPGRGVLGRVQISDLKVTLINSTSSRFSDNFTTADPPENITVELYQWFAGLLDSEKELIFKGVIRGQPEYSLDECKLCIRGIWDKYNKKIGEDLIISADDYSSADPDDIGKMQNICYGSLSKAPCRAISSGGVDNLAGDIDSSQVSIELSDASEMDAAGTIGIDEEEITYTGISTNTLTGCTRGANSTTAVAHASGSAVWQIKSVYVYQVAGHPVKSIGDIYVDGVRITSMATTYTGQTGNELAGYSGQAVFTVPSRLTRQQAVDLLVSDGLTINDAISVVDTIDVSDGISISDTIGVSDGISVTDNISVSSAAANKEIYPTGYTANVNTANPANAYDGNENTYAAVYNASFAAYCTWTFPSTSYGAISKQYVWVLAETGAGGAVDVQKAGGASLGTIPAGQSKGWFRFETTDTDWNEGVRIVCAAGESCNVYEIKKIIEYTPTLTKSGSASKSGTVTKTGSASKSGTVTKTGSSGKSGTVTRSGSITLTGNSMADVRIGKLVCANLEGYQDDGAGTYTGTPSALIERPDHVFKHIWVEILGAPSGDFSVPSATATYFSTNSYAFALLINQSVQAADLLMKLALQCRSRFLVTAPGQGKLILRQLGQSSGHSIVKNEIKCGSVKVQRSDVTDLINLFHIHYDKDHSIAGNVAGQYLGVKKFTDATSITRYGQREWTGKENVFWFDAVTSSAMVADVGAYLLDYHEIVRKLPHFSVFLDNCELEPSDIIDVSHEIVRQALDYTICTVVDPNGRFAITENGIVVTGLARNEDAYACWDFGADYFKHDFEHDFKVKLTGHSGAGSFYPWSLINVLDDLKGITDASGDWLTVSCYCSGGVYQIYCLECDGGTIYGDGDYFVAAVDTQYYCTIKRDETVGTFGTLYLYIYTDASRSTLVDTLTVTLHTSKKDFRYLCPIQCWHSGSTATISGTVANHVLKDRIVCDVLKIVHRLGSARRKVIDHLEVVAVEN